MAVLTVGVDVSQDKLDVARVDKAEKSETVDVGTFDNDEQGFKPRVLHF